MPPSAMTRAAVVTHGKTGQIGAGIARLQAVAQEYGVELLYTSEEAEKHSLLPSDEAATADIAVVLGGDGTMLRALTRFLGTGIPVIGVNFGRVGFLSSMGRRDLEAGLARVFAGEYEVVELPTLELEHPEEGGRRQRRRRRERLARADDRARARGRGEELGRQPCDGIICSTPSGSTAYNLSNGGPVLMWGLEAMALTYVAAHSLHAPARDPSRRRRDRVEPDPGRRGGGARGRPSRRNPRQGRPGGRRIGAERSLLATLPDATFVRRYRQSFAS